MHLLITSPQNVFESPKEIIETVKAAVPSKRMGLRPIMSERRLQYITVTREMIWATESCAILDSLPKNFEEGLEEGACLPSTQHSTLLSLRFLR